MSDPMSRMNNVMAGRASRRRCRSSERAPLPGEVVSRRRRTERKEAPEEPPLQLDPRAVLGMKPDRRLKWLMSALQRLQQGKVQSAGIYDILVHPKFPQDASTRIGSKMYVTVCEHMAFFSAKQQRFLESECKLAQLFKDKAATAGGEGGAAPAAPSGEQPENAEALVDKLLTLPPSEGEKFMATLDEALRDRLEELLEARILAKARGGAPEPVAPAAPAPVPTEGSTDGGAAAGRNANGGAAGGGANSRSSSASGSSDGGRSGRSTSRGGRSREKARKSRSRSRGRGRSPSQGRRRQRNSSRSRSRRR